MGILSHKRFASSPSLKQYCDSGGTFITYIWGKKGAFKIPSRQALTQPDHLSHVVERETKWMHWVAFLNFPDLLSLSLGSLVPYLPLPLDFR